MIPCCPPIRSWNFFLLGADGVWWSPTYWNTARIRKTKVSNSVRICTFYLTQTNTFIKMFEKSNETIQRVRVFVWFSILNEWFQFQFQSDNGKEEENIKKKIISINFFYFYFVIHNRYATKIVFENNFPSTLSFGARNMRNSKA